jgi:superfamily II DNA or RNA helicase
MDIILHPIDEVYMKLECEKSTAQEVSDFFTFTVPGFQFTPAFRNKTWDGKIRLFHLTTYRLYRGLLEHLKTFCSQRNYTMDTGNLEVQDEFSVYHANKFIQNLNIHSRGNSIDVRDYQRDAFIHAMQNHRTLLLSPTASGKSLIIYLIYRQLLEYQNMRGLVITPRTDLVSQLYSDFQDYSSHNKFDVEKNVHYVYQGRDKVSNKSLIITTWQSIYKMPLEYFRRFDYVIGDESHLFKAQSLSSIMTNCTNAKYRIGLTGTLDGTKVHKLVLEGLFGPVRQVTTTKQLMDAEQLAKFSIKCLVLNYPTDICQTLNKTTYQEELEYLVTNQQRNKFIKNLGLSLNGNTLILYQFVEKHGQILYDMILNSKNIGTRKVFFVHGGVDADEREQVRKITEMEKDAIIVASYGTFSTGTNIRNLHNIISASPSKSRVRVLQSIGRSLRLGDNKESATLYDIADDLRYGKRKNHTLNHFMERVDIYNNEQFQYKMYKIQLKGTNNG